MEEQSVEPALAEQLRKLQAKYNAMGQDLSSYLDGLLHADYLTYWDYIHLDTLLTLQTPKTQFQDEKVFILYHQITELYFQLTLHELEQLAASKPTAAFFLERLNRIVRYFRQLESSFEIMTTGMEREQFMKFRMALLPSSGFQSAQFRLIEFASTDLINLVQVEQREQLAGKPFPELFDHIYWKSGATELGSGRKTLTLNQFEEKYSQQFLQFIQEHQHTNLAATYKQLDPADPLVPEITKTLREWDELVNIRWRFAHLKSSGHYLHRSPEDIKATGGTNWQKYLPPRYQQIIFFPELFSADERREWGRR